MLVDMNAQGQTQRFGGSLVFRVFMIAFAVIFEVLGAISAIVVPLLAVMSDDEIQLSELGNDVLAVVLLFAIAVACHTLERRSVSVSPDGVELTKLIGSRRWTWSQITDVEVRCERDLDARMSCWPLLVLASGEHVDLDPAWSTSQGPTSAAERAAAAIRTGMVEYRQSMTA